jgi:hypothetical protein
MLHCNSVTLVTMFLFASSPRETLVAEQAATVKQASQLANTTHTIPTLCRRDGGARPAGRPGGAAPIVQGMAATLSSPLAKVPPAQNYTTFQFGAQDTKLIYPTTACPCR